MTEIIVTSSVLILILIILRRILRRWIDPRVQYALWLLVAARLLIPGTLFTAPVSVMGAAEDIQTAIYQTVPGSYTPDQPVSPPEEEISGANALIPPSEAASLEPSAAAPAENAVFFLPEFDMREIQTHNWVDIIWKTGIVVVGGAMLLSNLVFYLRLRKSRKRMDLPTAPWAHELTVYAAKGLSSPCLFGIFRPAVYLNRAAMCAEHPEHILAHEYAHYRHGDHLWSILRCVCAAVHWYNPLVWWAVALSRQDCELACDASALRRLGEEAAIDYGQTLLSMISRSRNPAALLRAATTMTAGKRTMKQRITLIIQRPKMRKITVVLVAILTVFLAASAFGHAMDATTEPSDEMPVSTSNPVQPADTGDASAEQTDAIFASPTEMVLPGSGCTFQFQVFNVPGIYTLTYESSDPSVASVDSSGVVTAVDPGEAIITAHLESESGVRDFTCAVRCGTNFETETVAESIMSYVHAGIDPHEWLLYLGGISWSDIARLQGDNQDYIMEVEEAIYNFLQTKPELTDVETLTPLISAQGLDGAYSQMYAEILYTLYEQDPNRVATIILSDLYPDDKDAVLTLLTPVWSDAQGLDDLSYQARKDMLEAQLKRDRQAEDPVEPVLPAEQEDTARYNEVIMSWQRAVGPTMSAAPAVPDQELIYDDLTEDGLHNAVVSTLERYVTNNIFTHSLGDPADRLALDHVELESEPSLEAGQTDLTVNYHYVCKATLELPDGQPYTATFAGSTLSTTFTAMSSTNVMGNMLANGAMGNLPGQTGDLMDLPGEMTNEWQRGFFGFVFGLPAMPPQTLDAETADNLETALSMLSSYYQDYVAQNGSREYNDRFSRVIFVSTATESTADSVTLEVQYQVECLRDREYEGKTYTLAPQTGDELKTTFIFMKTTDSAAQDDAAAAQFDQWVQRYLDILSPAPEGHAGYDSADERSLYEQVHSSLYPYVLYIQVADDFDANCYDYDVQLAFSVPNEVPASNFTLSYYVKVTAATRLPSGEIHSISLTSRELTTTVTVAQTAD